MRFLAQGEQGLVVELGDGIDPAVNARVHRLARAIAARLAGVVDEVVPAYRSLLVVFDPLRVERSALARRIEELAGDTADAADPAPPRLVRMPVCYGGELGPDLDLVAEHAGLSPEDVVRLHASATYRVYLLGFMPGFAYLGGMSPSLATPRLASPRARVAAGTVGIAGEQTGIYPIESPGGWRLIGRTPLRLFDPAAAAPFLLAPGDRVRFIPVPRAGFDAIAADVAAGRHRPDIARLGDGGLA